MADLQDSSVDPELEPLIEGFPPIDLSAETLAQFRAAIAEMSVLPDPATHPDVSIEQVRIPGTEASAPNIPCLLFRPHEGAARGALLHIHGGGFVMGRPEMDAARNIDLVRATGLVILSVDYRLAPEHPHPAALEDCYAAITWLAAQATALGAPAGRIGVIGESAGGGLAAALALTLRDRGAPALVCQVLVFPMLAPPESSVDRHDPDRRTGRFIWTRQSNAFAWSAMLPDPAMDRSAIPAEAGDLSRLPPAFLAVGDLDLFVHDNLAFASRLMRAGNPVELHVYPGAIHGFDRMTTAAVAQRFTAELIGFLKRHYEGM